MLKGFVGSLAVMAVGAAAALAQPMAPYYPATSPWNGAGAGVYAPVEWAPPASEEGYSSGGYPVDTYAPYPPAYREFYWVGAQFLLYQVKDGPLPVALATTGPATLVPNNTGILGQAGTSVLVGNGSMDYDTFPGGRVYGGVWVDPDRPFIGLDGSGFFLERQSFHATANSDGNGNPAVSIPYTDATTGVRSAFPLAIPAGFGFPPTSTGGVNVVSSSRLWGADTNIVGILYQGRKVRLTMLTGFRYFDLSEDLNITDREQIVGGGPGVLFFGGLPVAGGVPGVPNAVVIHDNYSTRNQIFGGQMGGRFEFHYKRFYFDLTTKMGLAANHQELHVNGTTTLEAAPGTFIPGPSSMNGGFFAVPGNSGAFKDKELATFTEGQVRVGTEIAYGLNTFIGYDVIHMTHVARPGDQIPRTVDPTQVPASAAFTPGFQTAPPSQNINHSSFWAQGVNVGLHFRY